MPRNRKHGGCITCRRRCRSCDKKRPACSQCANDGLVCGSYGEIEPRLSWVHATQETMRLNKGYSRPPSNIGSLPPSAPGTVSHGTELETSDVSFIVQEFLTNSSSEQGFLNNFIPLTLQSGQLLSSRTAHKSIEDWATTIEEFHQAEPSIRQAAEAMSIGLMSAISQSSRLWTRSMQTYNLSVGELVKTVKGRKCCPNEGVLAACRILQMYELLFGQAHGWKAYLEGQLAMFLARGPEAFVSGPAHQLYVDTRILMIILALGKRMKSPLSTPEWRSIPWRETAKSAMVKLLDILEDMIEILGDYDHLRACRFVEDIERFQTVVLMGCQHIEDRLESWQKEEGTYVQMFDYLATGLPQPAPLDATQFNILHISSIYWAVQILLYGTMGYVQTYTDEAASQLSEGLVSTNAPANMPAGSPIASNRLIEISSPHTVAPLSSTSDLRLYATKITQAMQLLLDADAAVLQGAATLFPMAMAAEVFAVAEAASESSEPSKESQMIFDMLGHQSLGAPVGRFLSQLQGGTLESLSVPSSQKRENIWWCVVLN